MTNYLGSSLRVFATWWICGFVSCLSFAQTLNLLKNGDFSQKMDHWVPHGSSGFAQILNDNNNLFLRLSSPGFLEQKILLQPEWSQLTIRGRMRCQQLIKGEQPWQTFRIALRFENKQGKVIQYPPMPELHEDTPTWVTKEVTIEIPKNQGAAVLVVQAAFFGQSGICDIDDISVEPIQESIPSTSKSPESQLGKNILKNGDFFQGLQYWKRQGPADKIVLQKEGDVSFLRLESPGFLEQKIILNPHWTRIRVSGKLRARDLVKGEQPWQTLRIALAFERQDGSVIQYPPMPELQEDSPEWTFRSVELDIPRNDGAHTLRVQAAFFGKSGICDITDIQVIPLAQTDPQDQSKIPLLILPSVREKKITIRVFPPATWQTITNSQLQFKVFDSDNTQVLNYQGGFHHINEKERMGEVQISWTNPQLWSLDRPYLYRLEYSITNDTFHAHGKIGFGFREFRIAGRQFLLNEQPIRLRPTVFDPYRATNQNEILKFVREKRTLGYNFIEIWPDKGNRSRYEQLNQLLGEICSQEGMGIAGALPHQKDFQDCNTDADLNRYLSAAQRTITSCGNHPSIWMWNHSANSYINGRDQDPRLLGRKGWTNVQEEIARFRKGEKITEGIKKIDPSRPVFSHAGGPVGDVYNLNCYLCMTPLQEREEWLSEWAKSGEMPLMMVEFGTPLWTTGTRGRAEYGEVITTELFMTEWAALYLGSQAYQMEPEWYLELLNKKYRSPFHYEAWRFGKDAYKMLEHPGWQKLQQLFIRNTWRTWRTWGISGGMIPWFEKEGPEESWLTPYNQPFLAWITGPSERFTSKDHHFYSQQTIQKQIAILHDGDIPAPVPYQLQIQVIINQRVTWEHHTHGTIRPGEILFYPFEFTTPSVSQVTHGTILLKAQVGPQYQAEDSFSFSIFPSKQLSPQNVSLELFDPIGETQKWLTQHGYRVQLLQREPQTQRVVIGRTVLSKGFLLPFDALSFLKKGGQILIMAQDPDWTRFAWGFRVARHLTRYVFPIDSQHPVMRGLTPENLQNWTGVSHLVDSYPYVSNGVEPWFDPLYGWRWGSQGTVTSCAIEKPHWSGWRPIFECEFDLAYTPLMELDVEKGRVLLCTLDLEDHASKDPAARILTHNLLSFFLTPSSNPSIKVPSIFAIGDCKPWSSFFANVTQSSTLPEDLTNYSTIILGKNCQVTENRTLEYIQKGGQVIVLPQDKSFPFDGIQLVEKENLRGIKNLPKWEELKGISLSDVRARAFYQGKILTKLTSSPTLEIAGDGLLARWRIGRGILLAIQINPETLPDQTHFRFTRWRYTRAISQILANMGVRFTPDLHWIRLITQPNVAIPLAGEWDGYATIKIPEKLPRSPHPDPGLSEQARQLVGLTVPPSIPWQKVKVPAYWESYGPEFRFIDGEMVFRKEIEIPPYAAGRDLIFSLGRIDETEETWWNGVKVGNSRDWLLPRRHTIPGNLVKAGKNVLAIRMWDEMIHGGWCGMVEHVYLCGTDLPSYYHPDYIEAWGKDFVMADDPYRYKRW